MKIDTNTFNAVMANAPASQTLGELRSIATADLKFRIMHDGPQVLEQVREWRKAFVDSRHPAAQCMFAAGVVMQDMLDFINRQEQEIQTWQAFAEQANKRNDELLAMTAVCVVRSGNSSNLESKA